MILTNIQNITFYEEIKITQGFPYISLSPLRSLYNSKFILMETSLRTNIYAIVVARLHCIPSLDLKKINKSAHSLLRSSILWGVGGGGHKVHST